MFYSQCFLSSKGPLSSVWVAAYCFNKLKKSQVAETDISFSVEKVLQDEFDAVGYRVLAYLLLGIVRIYSKKVDYLFNDCNKVLVKVKDFVVDTSDSSLVPFTAPCFTITLPESFELDAFDLGILEDTSGCNVLPLEHITLRDVTRRRGGSECLLVDKFRTTDVPRQDRCPAEDSLNDMLAIEYRPSRPSIEEDLEVFAEANDNCHQDSVEREMLCWVEKEPPDIGTSYSRVFQPEDSADSNEMCMQKVWDDSFCEALSLNVDMFHGIETQPVKIVEPLDECQQTEGQYSDVSRVPEAQNDMHHSVPSEIEVMIEEFQDNTSLQDQPVDYEMCPEVPFEHFGADCKDDAEPVDSLHTTSSTCLKRKFGLVYQRRAKKLIVYDASESVEASIEKLLDSRLSQDKNLQPETFSPVGGLPECATPCIKDSQSEVEPIKSVDSTPLGNTKYLLSRDDCPLSVTVDITPESRFLNTSGVSRTPEFSVIPTPAAKDTAPAHRRRKYIFDDIIVIPNDLIKQNLEDPCELVAKRRKIPRTALDSWRAYRLPDLHRCLMEPLIPCLSLEIGCIPARRRSKKSDTEKTVDTPKKNLSRYTIGQSTKTVEPADKLETLNSEHGTRSVETGELKDKSEMLDSQHGTRSVQTVELSDAIGHSVSPSIGRLVEGVESLENLGDSWHPVVDEAAEVGPQEKLDGHEPENAGQTSEQLVIAPGTPARLSVQIMNPPRELNTPELGYVSEPTRIAPETPMQYTGIVRSYESPERPDSCNSDLVGPRFDQKKGEEIDFNFMNEDTRAEDESQNMYGWSERTRVVARFLQKSFQEKIRNGEEEEVKLLQLLEGRSKKESARVFYEILVLKSKGHVEVKQESGYGEVVVEKASQWSCDE
ncbi:Sister chromatid cohesion 1 protein 2 [Linum perenne]